jgi:hypothetical protein
MMKRETVNINNDHENSGLRGLQRPGSGPQT